MIFKRNLELMDTFRERRKANTAMKISQALAFEKTNAVVTEETPARKELVDTLSGIVNRTLGTLSEPSFDFSGMSTSQKYTTPERTTESGTSVQIYKIQDNPARLVKYAYLPRNVSTIVVQASTTNDGSTVHEHFSCHPNGYGMGLDLDFCFWGDDQTASESVPVLEGDSNWNRLAGLIVDFQAAEYTEL